VKICVKAKSEKGKKKRQVGSETPVSQRNAEVLKCLFRCFESLFPLFARDEKNDRSAPASNETPICLLACTLRETKEEVKKICWVPSIPPGVLQGNKSKREDE
jgi:hypothetical protein